MHECTLLIKEELPNEDMIEKMLATFYEEDFYDRQEETAEPYPAFLYDYYQIGGRYAGMIKLNTSQKIQNIHGNTIQKIQEITVCFSVLFLKN